MDIRRDLLITPRYSLAEAGRLAGLSRGAARRWLAGYGYVYEGRQVNHPPVGRAIADAPAGEASFLDLVELVAISRLKDAGFSLRAVRSIADNCRDMFDVDRPLASLAFKTDGREIFIERGGTLVEVGRRRRSQAWSEVLMPFLESLDYDDTLALAHRWWPLGREGLVVVDPEFGFGLPVVDGSGVRTEILLERYRAGDLAGQIAQDFNLESEYVERAIQFEVRHAA